MFRKAALAAAAVLIAGAASAQTARIGEISVKDAVVRASPAGSTSTGGYLIASNAGAQPDKLVAAACDCAGSVMIHDMRMEGGIMRMSPAAQGLTVPAHGELKLQPGGPHLMIMGLKAPLKDGDKVKITLTFARAGKVVAQFPVKTNPSMPAAMHHDMAGMAGMTH